MRVRFPALIWLVVAVLLGAVPASARQAAAADYWHALERAYSLADVAAVQAPSGLSGPVAESLRLLRRYELEPVRSTAYRARWELQREVNRRPDNAWAQLALAMVLRRGPDAHVRNSDPPTYWFVDPNSLASTHALRALRRALELDPAFELAGIELARFAAERHDRALQDEADAVLARLEQAGEVLLQRAALAYERGDLDAVLRYASAAGRTGGDAGRAAHMRAMVLLLDPATHAMGAAAYLDGLRQASRPALAEYYRHAAPVLRVEETQVYDTLDVSRRAEWLEEMWELRAVLAGVPLEERLGVHMMRLREARTLYALRAPLTAEDNVGAGASAVLVGEELRRHGLSVPGLMLVRYGDPGWMRWLGVCGQDNIPYVSSSYRGAGRPLDAVLPPGQRRPLDGIDVSMSEDFRRIRMLDCGNPTAIRQFAEYIVRGDRFRPHYDQPLPVNLEVYAFRGVAGADIIAGVSVPRAPLVPVAAAGGVVHLHTAVAFVDSVARRSTRTEQPARFVLPPEAASHALLTVPSTTTLTGRVDVRVTVADTARRAGSVIALVHEVPDFSRGLVLSDLVIAPDEDVARTRRGDIALPIAAGRQYRTGETFRLFYEVYGLEEGARYRTRIVLAPQRSRLWNALQRVTGSEPDVIALQFEERAPAPHEVFGVQQLRNITTSSLGPGTYRLRIEVTDVENGRTTVRERLLDIHAR